MRGKFLEYLLSQPLLCTPEAADVAASLASRDDFPDIDALAGKAGREVESESGVTLRDGVAVVPIHGPITRHATVMTRLCGGVTTAGLARDLTTALENPSVRAVMLDVDTPGGQATGIGELAAMVRRANEVKPVCAYVGGEGASAGYWIASAAGEVVCAETAMLGSIGAVMGYRKKAPKAGEKEYEWVSSQSPNKRPDPETDEGRAVHQAMVDDMTEVFIDAVAAYRGVHSDTVKTDFGKGGVLIGRKAVAAGMADSVGDYETTLARLSRGERASGPKPQPRHAAPPAAKPTPGVSMLNPFTMIAKLWEKDSAAVIEAAGGDAVVADLLAKLEKGDVKTAASDAAAVEAKAAETVREKLTAFYGVQASAWFDDAVKGGKVDPAHKARMTALYVDAALADDARPLGDGNGRLAFVKDVIEKRPDSGLTTTAIKPTAGAAEVAEKLGDLQALPESSGATKDEADAIKARAEGRRIMLAATDAGKAILAAEKAAAK